LWLGCARRFWFEPWNDDMRTTTEAEDLASGELDDVWRLGTAARTGEFHGCHSAVAQMSHPEYSSPKAAGDDAHFPIPPTYFAIELEREWRVLTDRHRVVPLFRFEALIFPVEGEQLAFQPERDGREFLQVAERKFLANTRQDVATLVRLVEPHTACNCHGWVFAAGLFGIDECHIPSVLADNGYTPVAEAREGDLAIYWSGERVAHSGIVHSVAPDAGVLVASKWGPFGVYLHAPASHPFPGACRFYHSARGGHTMAIERA
jgi:hypothetical protein